MSISPHNIKEMTRIGHYDILDCIGRGGMGLVYLARDTRLDRQVAIKCLRTELFEPHYRERFKREALLLAKLNHPNIVQIYDFIETPDQLALVMEYVDGQNLQTRLREQLVPMAQRMVWLTQIAQGLAVAHDSGIIHRDLKAENILINQRNLAKISDLGIAKSQDFSATITDHVAGSYASMSPEQAMGEALDFKSDLFSFGILAYQMLCGAHPFGDTNNKLQLMQRIISHPPVPPTKHNPNLPPEICNLLGQLLSKNVDNRPDNTHWVANQFEKLSLLVSTTPEWSNDTELTPQQASLRKLHTDIPTATTASDSGFATFDARYTTRAAPQPDDSASFFSQQKTSIIIGAVVMFALIGLSFWLLQPRPPEYIAVIPPRLVATGMHESQQELIKAAAYDAMQQSVIQLKGYYLVPQSEVADVDDDMETIFRATAADELITLDLQCNSEACSARISRLIQDETEDRLRVANVKMVDLLADKYLSAAAIIQRNVGSLYSQKLSSETYKISEAEYQKFLTVNRDYRSNGASADQLKVLDELGSSTRHLSATQTLYREIALDLFHVTRDNSYLGRLSRFLSSYQQQDDFTYLSNLHHLKVASNETNEAAEIADKLKSINISSSTLNELNALTMLKQHDYSTAAQLYRAAISTKPTANNYFNAANAYWYSGNTTLAKEYLTHALDLAPNFYKALTLHGQIALLEGDLELAKSAFEKTLAQRQDDIINMINLGLTYLLSRNYSEAEEVFRRAAQSAPNQITLLLNIGDAENLGGRTEASYRTYREVIEKSETSNSAESLRNKAQAHAHLGEITAALDNLQRLQQLDPQNIETTFTAALVHTLAKNNAAALFNIENTIKNGMNPIWFSFPWFDRLCTETAFVDLMNNSGENQRCSPLQ
jgi:Serine/threonine protein kinase